MTTFYTKTQFLSDAKKGMKIRPIVKPKITDGHVCVMPWQPVVKASSKRIESVARDEYSGGWMHPAISLPKPPLFEYRDDDKEGKIVLIYHPGYRQMNQAEKKALAKVKEMTEAEAKEYLASKKMLYLLGIESNGKKLSTDPNTYQFVLDEKVKGRLRSAYRIKIDK